MNNEELRNLIIKRFKQNVKKDDKIQSFYKKLLDQEANQEDVSLFALNLGTCAADSINAFIKKESLPYGKLTSEIAIESIKPVMYEVYNMVCDASCTVIRYEDEKIGIRLIPQSPPFPEEKIEDLVIKMVEVFNSEENE